jgi:5-methylcytosine-specific restriction protein A
VTVSFGGYEVGKTYNRRQDIHKKLGGQMQGGICTPKNHPVVIAFTGETGRQHGYADGWTPEGIYRYFGEGQVGDMTWKGGNGAIRDHAGAGEELLLFQTLGRGMVRFVGDFVCAGYNIERAPDRLGTMRDAIVFNLVPLAKEDEIPEVTVGAPVSDLETLRRRALEAIGTPSQGARATAKRTLYERSRDIRLYVLARAEGCCEACARPAPFSGLGGAPYLEPHHIRRLSDGGPDDPRHMAAVCPNCHREIHYGVNGRTLNKRVQGVVTSREADLASRNLDRVSPSGRRGNRITA